jgi:uncharacterized SAM-binding protein YcdF (DUF218 family)
MSHMKSYTDHQIAVARELFDYLYLSLPAIRRADVIIGFGHFDLGIPRRCGELYTQGYAERIIFTGGIGSGTADLNQPEAQAFLQELRRSYPDIPSEAVILEAASTNTSENIQYTREKLDREFPNFVFGREIQSAMLVANAYRQRRVWLTCRKQLPMLTFANAPPKTTFERECRLFADKGFDLPELLIGEIERLVRYAEAGYIVSESLPDDVYQRYEGLKGLLT